MEKKGLRSDNVSQLEKLKENSPGHPHQLRPAELDYLLSHFQIRSYLSGEELQQEINRFDIFVKDPKNAGKNTQECIDAFSSKKKWVNQDDVENRNFSDERDSAVRINFNIAGAVLRGWLWPLGRKSKEDLITKKRGEKGNFAVVYRFPCSNSKCGKRLSQYQYDRIKGKYKICPYCKKGKLKPIKARDGSWENEMHRRRQQRELARRPQDIPVSAEQLAEYEKARDAYDQNVTRKWQKLTAHGIPTGEKIDAFRVFAKPYIENINKTLPVEKRLCTRADCLNVLPAGSRNNRQYCSERCKSIMKSRRARRK